MGIVWLSGGHSVALDAVLPPEAGWMLQPGKNNVPTGGRVWGADNGRFSKPERYTDAGYLAWLGRLSPYRARCLFATAPDVVGDARATLALSAPLLPRIRALGYPAALVAQDGLEDLDVPWDAIDCLFVGGTTDWKLSPAAYGLAREAEERGKWTHMGRCNSLRRLRAATTGRYRSADGTQTAFRPDQTGPQMAGWLARLRQQMELPLWG